MYQMNKKKKNCQTLQRKPLKTKAAPAKDLRPFFGEDSAGFSCYETATSNRASPGAIIYIPFRQYHYIKHRQPLHECIFTYNK